MKAKLAMLWLALAVLAGCTTPRAACVPDQLAYIGTDGSQLRALRLDACAGKLSLLGPVADVKKPRWTVSHPTLPILYAALDGDGQEGSVIAYAVNRQTGALGKLGEVGSGGSGATHLALDAASMTLLVSNFGDGSVSSIALQPDGRPGPRISALQATGSGPHRRQASPHAHHATLDPSGRHALVSDMGADRVFVYGFDRATRALAPDNAARSFAVAPGSGPRRALFGADGRFVYVLNELTAQLQVLRWDAQAARLSPVHSLPLSSPHFQGARSGSELALSRDGRFLYAGNRGENQLVVLRIDPASGELAQAQRVASAGEALWHFDLHASGRWMLVAHHRSNKVSLFAVDPVSGALADTGQAVTTPAPVSAVFMR